MKKELKIHSHNILPIIKKWLYSEKEIFIRELVSNGCDALFKLKVLKERGEAVFGQEELRIDITLEKEKIIISDTGIGMTSDEIEKYIAQIAFSGAEEFALKYENNKDQIIGHFGLGFYSAYMVAERVDIDTLSFLPGSQAAFWSCDGTTEYTIEESKRAERGTTITLHVSKDHEDVLNKTHFKSLLEQYCRFLPYPIYLDGEQINSEEPLWNKPAVDCTQEEYTNFFRELYPMEEEPLFSVHLNVDYPFNLKGILYFPRLTKSTNFKESHIQLFCNRVFVSHDAASLLPEYLRILKGALDSPDIPLNVSRSTLQMDRTVRQLATHISRKVVERLQHFFDHDREAYYKAWPHLEVIVKLGILQDEKFCEKAEGLLIWKSTKGNYLTLKEYKERFPSKIYYTPDNNPSLIELFHEKGQEILISDSLIDISVFSFLESKNKGTFQRLDGALDESLLDASREKTLLDSDGRTFGARLSSLVKERLNISDLQIEAKSLASDTLPAFVMIDERERRMRDYMAMHQPEMALPLQPKRTFILNTNSPLIQSIESLDQKDPTLSTEILSQLLNLSLLSQKELDAPSLSTFVKKETELLERLTMGLSQGKP